MIDEIKEKLKDLSDADLLSLLDVISEEIKNRNTILGPPSSRIRKDNIEKGLKAILEAMTKASTG